MAHDHGHFIVAELQFVQNAVIKSNLAAGHAKRIDLRRADQVDFPFPFFGARVPFVAEGNEFLRDGAQTNHLGVVIGGECVFVFGLLEQLPILLVGRALYLSGRNQFGKARGFANLDAIARKQCRSRQAKRATCATVDKLTFGEHRNEMGAGTSQYKV